MSTEVGQEYNGEVFTNIVNIGHGFLSIQDGIVIGRLTYPGPSSGGLSSIEGDCSAITALMPWIVGAVPVDNTKKMPKAVIDSSGNMVSAGYVDLPKGARWLVSSVDGVATYGDPPATTDQKAAAKKSAENAILVLSAAVGIAFA